MSLLNKWDYSGLSDACFSDAKQESYKRAAAFLGDSCEDWGCGTGWAKKYFRNYHGVDGSPSRMVSEEDVVDLTTYKSDVENILMREVLEYNEQWEAVLENVKSSFRNKFCLIVSTPLVDKTRVGVWHKPRKADGSEGEGKIPEVYFNREELLGCFPAHLYRVTDETIKTEHLYGQDWILYVERLS